MASSFSALPPQSVPPLAAAPTGARETAPAEALFTKTWWLAFSSLWAYVATLTPAAVSPAAAAVTVVDITLTANTTLTAANTVDPTLSAIGALLGVFLRQDATGGWTIAWTGTVFRGGPGGLSTKLSTWTLVMFVCQEDPADNIQKWWLQSLVTNQT